MIGPRVNGNSGIRFGRKGDSRSRRDVLGKDEKKGKRGEGKGRERKGKERTRQAGGPWPGGAHAAVRLGSSTSSGMRGITYRNTTTSTTASPPTASSVHRKHRMPREEITCESTLLDRPISLSSPLLPSSRANDSSGVMCPPLCSPGDLEYQLPLQQIVSLSGFYAF